MDMNRTLHDTNNAQRILKLTADTMLLVDKNGVCIDIDPHCDLWFLQDEILLGKNIFELLPEYTRERVVPVFQSVLEGKKSVMAENVTFSISFSSVMAASSSVSSGVSLQMM